MALTNEAGKAYKYLQEHYWSMISEAGNTLIFKSCIDDREHIDIIKLMYYNNNIYLEAYNTFMLHSISIPLDIYKAVVTIAEYMWGDKFE